MICCLIIKILLQTPPPDTRFTQVPHSALKDPTVLSQRSYSSLPIALSKRQTAALSFCASSKWFSRHGTLYDSTAPKRRCGDSTARTLATCLFWTQCERYKNATFGVTCVKPTPYGKSSYPCYLCVHVRIQWTGRALKLESKSQLLD